MKRQWLVGVGVALCCLGGSALAGDGEQAPEAQMYCIFKEVVKPSMAREYEAATKRMISEFTAYGIDPEKVNFMSVSGPELGYVYVIPLESFATMDEVRENWMAAVETIGEARWEELTAAASAAVENQECFHVVRRPGLSYTPENPRFTRDEVTFVHYGFYYAIPGKEKELEQIAQEYVELARSKGLDTGWSLYQALTGTDLPVYVVAHAARSESDFHSQKLAIREQLGPEGKELGEKVLSVIRKTEFKEGWLRPDLSYPPPTEPAPAEEGGG